MKSDLPPIIVDGVRYNPVPDEGSCAGCAASWQDSLCGAIRIAGGGGPYVCHGKAIWLTDADYAVYRLTQGDPP